jgi:hypothetical protein
MLGTPATVTTTFPVDAPAGTTATILVVFQLVIDVAGIPLNATEPCVDPNPEPVMVTAVPTSPEVGDTEVMLGTDCAAAGVRHTARHEIRATQKRIAL